MRCLGHKPRFFPLLCHPPPSSRHGEELFKITCLLLEIYLVVDGNYVYACFQENLLGMFTHYVYTCFCFGFFGCVFAEENQIQ